MRDAIFERRVAELAEATARDLLASAGPGGRSAVTAAEATLAAIRRAQDFPSEAQASNFPPGLPRATVPPVQPACLPPLVAADLAQRP